MRRRVPGLYGGAQNVEAPARIHVEFMALSPQEQRYAHLLDPRSAHAAEPLRSVTLGAMTAMLYGEGGAGGAV